MLKLQVLDSAIECGHHRAGTTFLLGIWRVRYIVSCSDGARPGKRSTYHFYPGAFGSFSRLEESPNWMTFCSILHLKTVCKDSMGISARAARDFLLCWWWTGSLGCLTPRLRMRLCGEILGPFYACGAFRAFNSDPTTSFFLACSAEVICRSDAPLKQKLMIS